MMPLNSPAHDIREAKRLVESGRRSEIRLKANGGNSILVVCDPIRESEYISRLEELLPKDNYSLLDLNKCLLEFVSGRQSDLVELFSLLQSAIQEIFKAPAGEESPDLFKQIITRLEKTFEAGKVPVLINIGSLYGTGIDHIHIMENEIIMKASLPAIILYPATKEADKLLFLGKQPVSRYRCMVIE